MVKLVSKGWVRRVLRVTIEGKEWLVDYNGHGMGFEEVRVNGESVVRTVSWLWFVPSFEFDLGNAKANIEVAVWPWFVLRKFKLTVNGNVEYQE